MGGAQCRRQCLPRVRHASLVQPSIPNVKDVLMPPRALHAVMDSCGTLHRLAMTACPPNDPHSPVCHVPSSCQAAQLAPPHTTVLNVLLSTCCRLNPQPAPSVLLGTCRMRQVMVASLVLPFINTVLSVTVGRVVTIASSAMRKLMVLV